MDPNRPIDRPEECLYEVLRILAGLMNRSQIVTDAWAFELPADLRSWYTAETARRRRGEPAPNLPSPSEMGGWLVAILEALEESGDNPGSYRDEISASYFLDHTVPAAAREWFTRTKPLREQARAEAERRDEADRQAALRLLSPRQRGLLGLPDPDAAPEAAPAT